MNILRGSFALAFALICASLFMTRPLIPARRLRGRRRESLGGEPKAALAFKEADPEPALCGAIMTPVVFGMSWSNRTSELPETQR